MSRFMRDAITAASPSSTEANTLTAQSGATLSDLMTRMGHSSTRAARLYLHTTSERDRAVAEALNQSVLWPDGHVAGTTAVNSRGGPG